MELIKLDQTRDTPGIIFDFNQNKYEIFGKSMPENAFDFYKPLYEWMVNFSKNHENKGIQLDVNLDYLNSSSIKLVFIIFNQLNDYYKNTTSKESTCINWGFKSDDDLIIMKGQEFKETLDIPFNLVPRS
jgi:hypothetical protein